MKRYFLAVLAGLLFGFASGCFSMWIAYGDSLPVPADEHWYDLAAVFSMPGEALTWLFFKPPDGYYGDLWNNRNHIVLLNSVSWMLTAHLFFCLRHLGKLAASDWETMRLMRITRRQISERVVDRSDFIRIPRQWWADNFE